MSENDRFEQLLELTERYIDQAKDELAARLGAWPIDLEIEDVQAVFGALLARQVSLAIELARSPTFWNGHVAPLVLRAMADVYISVVWIAQGPAERSSKFIAHGLGQAKLQLEHRKAEFKTREPDSREQELVKALESWIDKQQFTFLTDINLGSWSGMTARQMAEEAGCLDFYNYVYTPFSSCVHSMWNHIALYNLKECHNPLHRQHEVGSINETPFDPDYLYNAAKYLQKTFLAFDKMTGIMHEGPSAFDTFCDGLDKLATAAC